MKKTIFITLLCLSAYVLISCSGAVTEISGTWTKPGYKGKKYNNILVVAISDEIVKRNSVELALVNELNKEKIKSTTSISLLDLSKTDINKDGKIDSIEREKIKKTVNDAGYDAAIVISLLDTKEKTEYVPGQSYYQPSYYGVYGPYGYNGFYNYAYNTYSVVNTPGYYVHKKYIYIETRLFDLKTDDMVWASQSETKDPSDLKDFSSSLASATVNSLLSGKIVR
jgi:hypothetical protein